MADAKYLYLLRHAEATNASDDKARALTEQGHIDAEALGRYMKSAEIVPDLVLCSSANRTKQTLAGIQKSLEGLAVKELDILYSGTAEDYMHLLNDMDGTFQKILIVGHNPSIYALAHGLSKEGSRGSLMLRMAEGYHPATLSVLECPIKHWIDLRPSQNPLIEYVNPTDYNAPDRPTRWM